MNKEKIQFSFDPDFQREILQFTVTDLKYGFKAVTLFESHYFTTTEHAIIAEALKRYYNRRSSVPSLALLKEELKSLFRLKQWQSLVSLNERKNIIALATRLYKRPVRDAEAIYDACRKFAQYSAFKDELESLDLMDFESYQDKSAKIHAAINIGTDLTEDKGLLLLADAKSRLTRRRDIKQSFPTPWWQLNKMLNSGGTTVGNIIVLMGPAKRFKTGFMINTARGYLRQGRVVLYADMENGEEAIAIRFDQSIINQDRKALLKEDTDIEAKLLKLIRQYKRFGGELAIRRFHAGATTRDISKYITWLYETHGIVVTDLICDYPDVMGDTKNSKDETARISQVYIDLKNLGKDHDLQSIWCPSHVTREGDKAQGKKFRANDTAKAIDKVRHADIILGIQQDDDEKAAGIIRVEMVDQRDGVQEGRIYLHGDLATQRLKEFTQAQVVDMELARAESNDEPPSHKNKKETSDI